MWDKATGGTDPASCLIALTGTGDAPDRYYGKDEPVMGIRLRHLSVGTAIVAAIVAVAVPASAVVVPPQPGTRAGSNTEMTMSGTGPGQSVTGFIAIAPFDPLSGYPPSNPPSGFAPKDEGFAGVITGAPTDGSPPLQLYCIDINTNTWGGIGYVLGTWESSGVPNVGYVARILNNNFPTVPTQPTGPNVTTDAQRAAATQAAIWYFSDKFVLNTSDPLHDAVAALVAATIAAGPLVQPPPPTLTITPADVGGPTGTPVGPFTVTSTAATTVAAVGGSMFGDAAATQPIANGSTVVSGTQIWLTSSGPASAVLAATSVATVPSGNVYLYDGNTSGVNDAQRLILSQPATLRTSVAARANFLPSGSLIVTKTITGPAAGQQGAIVIAATCNGTVLQPLFVIPAGTAAGSLSQTYTGIPANSTCSVVEISDGHTPTVTVLKPRSGQLSVVPPGGTATADITDTYDSGSLVVNKTITGTGAGLQGAINITVNCGGVPQLDFDIADGSPAGTLSKSYANLIAGTVCTVTETTDGSSATLLATTEGSPQQVIIAANGSGTANLTDTYQQAPGALTVTKTISGPAAGQQDAIGFLVSCGGPEVFTFIIPAATAASSVSRTFPNVPAGAVCTVTEALTGASALVSVVTTGSTQQVTIPTADTAILAFSDLFDLVPVPPANLPPQPVLPPTGASPTWMDLALVAAAMLLVGSALMRLTRRRPAR